MTLRQSAACLIILCEAIAKQLCSLQLWKGVRRILSPFSFYQNISGWWSNWKSVWTLIRHFQIRFLTPALSSNYRVLRPLSVSMRSPSLSSVMCHCSYIPSLPTNLPVVRHERLIDWELPCQATLGKQSMLTSVWRDCSRSLRHPGINIHVACCHPVTVPCHVLYVCSHLHAKR